MRGRRSYLALSCLFDRNRVTFINSLGRNVFGACLAWLAVLSMGALAVQRDAAGLDSGGGAKLSMVRALVDAPVQAGRIGAVKLTAHLRTGDDHRRGHGGPDPLLLAALPVAQWRALPRLPAAAHMAVAIDSWPAAPYAARAPPPSAV